MTNIALVVLVHTSLLSAGPETYAEAHRVTTETGKPMVVMVSTEWCAPCQTMKRQVIPQIRKKGLLKRVAFAVVNPDRNRSLARKLTGGGPIPQLVMYRRTANGWTRRKLIGGQSVATVEKFINEGVALNKASKKAPNSQAKKQSRETNSTNATNVTHRSSS